MRTEDIFVHTVEVATLSDCCHYYFIYFVGQTNVEVLKWPIGVESNDATVEHWRAHCH